MTLSTPVVVEGTELRIDVSGDSRSWVGLYAAGAADKAMIARAEVGSDGSVRFTAPAAGAYELRLFAADSYSQIGTAKTLIVSPGPELMLVVLRF